MILNVERKLLKFINYDLFIRDKLIVDRVGLFLESIRPLMDSNDFDKFQEYIKIISSLCFKIGNLIFEDLSIIKESDFSLTCVAVIQAGLVIATKRDGKLPITIKCKRK
jgi:hypothetical protein